MWHSSLGSMNTKGEHVDKHDSENQLAEVPCRNILVLDGRSRRRGLSSRIVSETRRRGNDVVLQGVRDMSAKSILSLGVVVILVAGFTMNASADIVNVAAQVNPFGTTTTVSSTDLINATGGELARPLTMAATPDITGSGVAMWGSSLGMLNNGFVGTSYGTDGTQGTTLCLAPTDGTVVTAVLNTSVNTLGYDINSIVSLTSHQDLYGQSFDVSYTTVSDSTWIHLSGDTAHTVNRTPVAPRLRIRRC